jgi:hypothetical protein
MHIPQDLMWRFFLKKSYKTKQPLNTFDRLFSWFWRRCDATVETNKPNTKILDKPQISDGIPELPPGHLAQLSVHDAPTEAKGHHHSFPNSAGCSSPSPRAGRAPIQIQVSPSPAAPPPSLYPLGILIVPVPLPPPSIGDPSRTGFDPLFCLVIRKPRLLRRTHRLLCSVE